MDEGKAKERERVVFEREEVDTKSRQAGRGEKAEGGDSCTEVIGVRVIRREVQGKKGVERVISETKTDINKW